MPRIIPTPTRIFKTLNQPATSESQLLSFILKATGDKESAVNELRWLRTSVHARIPSTKPKTRDEALLALCERRGKHEPLQYILGSQPFGELEIKCRQGVLIPRPETEAYTLHVSKLLTKNGRWSRHFKGKSYESIPDQTVAGPTIAEELNNGRVKDSTTPAREENKYGQKQSDKPSLNILDICSGSGCISLLLHSRLNRYFPNLTINGWDISATAITLATENLRYNIAESYLKPSALSQVHYNQGDIFAKGNDLLKDQLQQADIIISNPPYVSQLQYETETTESVRSYEPKIALVPVPLSDSLTETVSLSPHKGSSPVPLEDTFYAHLLGLLPQNPSCRLLIMEIGDSAQASRVARNALQHAYIRDKGAVEIWRDAPDQNEPDASGEDATTSTCIDDVNVPILGAGKMRTVVVVLRPREEGDECI